MTGYIYYAIVESVKSLFANQPDLEQFTSQTNQHEPNLSFHLANELWKYFSYLNCDFDVIKPELENKRPDIIFHRRGTNFNLLVIEVKREKNDDVTDWKCASDEDKIRNYWFSEQLQYLFGASIVIDEQNSEFAFVLLQNHRNKILRFNPEDAKKSFDDDQEITALVDQIIEAKKSDASADTSALEHEIDELVYQIYGLTDDEIAIVEGRV